ncbi:MULTISPECIES: ABC transporter substrate-binding protein [Pseudoalteromonas]|uniref:ABC-type sugar transport system, periplasmic component n=1 Tax=Pseudoalteromonas luteoviolacea (strain 2ta16) TaxID=1353533 RepID=V4I2K7_PSEL2|nr:MULTISPECIES: ABC transporter substrate-binding protein [Pseudoalteromonas]ESP94459.1 ABC-type sugar transport system, periplasmic component [Pseudoalteromonas luteoviolacea 2ta16]MCG7547956.1 ABC transporter substrate-binding protein [Pseudoalteromonas sp. Of7M-16]
MGKLTLSCRKVFVFITLFCISYLHPISAVAAQDAARLKVTFVNPGSSGVNPTGNFWLNVSKVMSAVAQDTNIDLTILYAERNHILMKELTKQALESDADYLILVDEKRVITEALLDSPKVHPNILFLLNSPNQLEINRLSAKGFGIKAAILPDNYQAGKELARELVKTVQKDLTATESFSMLAFLGDIATNAALEREQGLLSYTNRISNVNIVDKVDAHWSQQRAHELARGLLRRHRNVELIWCANDAIAFGVNQAAIELGIRDKIKIGGVNWDSGHEDKLDVSIGGHVFLGGYLLIELKKYQRGLVKYIGTQKVAIFRPYSSTFEPVYKAIHEDNLNQIDFSQFVDGKKSYTIMTLNKELNF